MKRLAITAIALSLLAGTAANAAGQRHDDRRDDRRYEQSRYDNRHDRRDDRRAERRDDRRDWRKGQRLDSRYRSNSYYVSDYRSRGLRQPPRGYRWQRVDDRYILAAVATGLIASVIIANH